MKKVCTLYMIFLCTVSFAQSTYKGTLENWPYGKADIILPTDEPITIGTVSKKGKVSFALDGEVAQEITKTKEEGNANDNRLKIRGQSVERSFYCRSDDVVVEGGDLLLEKVTSKGAFYVGKLQNEELYGSIRLASSESFSNSYFKLGKKDFVTGHYIDFFYIEEDASVQGICKSPTYTLDGKDIFDIIHEYAIDLKKGWNMVRIEVADTYTDQEGNVRPLKIVMKTLTEIPEDTKFIYVSEF